MGTIMSTAEVESALVFFETTYPTLCHRVELPNKTIENRTCHALHMGLPNAAGHPAGLIIGGVHAREWAGPDIVVSFAGDILKAYSSGNRPAVRRKVVFGDRHQTDIRTNDDRRLSVRQS